jgi:aspartate 1-decarboxylase
MFRKLLGAKIHGATITGADLEYEGSLTLPPELLEATGIVPYESLHVWNVTRGTRLETYAIEGRTGSGEICANGAAAHHIFPGDRVIIATFTFLTPEQVAEHQPRVVFVDEHNRVHHAGPEVAGPQRREWPLVGSTGATQPAECDQPAMEH